MKSVQVHSPNSVAHHSLLALIRHQPDLRKLTKDSQHGHLSFRGIFVRCAKIKHTKYLVIIIGHIAHTRTTGILSQHWYPNTIHLVNVQSLTVVDIGLLLGTPYCSRSLRTIHGRVDI